MCSSDLASFLEHLASLVAVPPAHLVPDPRLLPSLPGTPGVLPTGAFRFVDVDPMWVESLVDGALSLGRVTEGDHVRDAQHNRTLPSRLGVSGILLRSRVVADYPDLAVDGYRLSSGSPPQNGANATAAAVAANAAAWTALDPVCLRRLAPDLLLALFYAPDGLDRVDLHLPPHGMHFGLTVEDQKGAATYLVQPRDVGTGKECGGPWPVAGCFRTDGTTVSDTPSATRVLALDKLAAVTVPAAAPRSSHTLAIQLLAQPLRVMIWRGAAETSS